MSDPCPTHPHVHRLDAPVRVLAGYLVHIDRGISVITANPIVAQRIADLLDVHGLATVPDHPTV